MHCDIASTLFSHLFLIFLLKELPLNNFHSVWLISGVSADPLAVLHAVVGRAGCGERVAQKGLADQAGWKEFFVSALTAFPTRLSESRNGAEYGFLLPPPRMADSANSVEVTYT